MEPEKVAPEAISEERLRRFAALDIGEWGRTTMDEKATMARELLAARQKIANLEAAFQEQLQIGHNLALLKVERDERIASLEQQLAALKESHAELMGDVSFICVLAETAPRDGAYLVLRLLPRTVQKYNEAFARAREVQK